MKKFLLVSAVSLLVVIGGGIWFLSGIFSGKPQVGPLQLTLEDFAVHNRLLGKVLREVSRRDGPEESAVTLSPQEIASLLRCADLATGQLLRRKLPLRAYSLQLRDGKVFLSIPVDTRRKLLFGGWIVCQGEFEAAKEGGNLTLQLLSCRIGKYPAPPEWFQPKLEAYLARFKTSGGYRIFDRSIRRFSVDKAGNVTITYRPKEALRLLLRQNFN